MKKIIILLLSIPSLTQAAASGKPPKGGSGVYVLGADGTSTEVPTKIEISAQLAPIAAGDPDRSFGVNGYTRDLSATSSFYAMVKDSSNRLVVCGFGNNSSAKAWIVARYTSTGVLDTTFGSGLGYVQENGIGVSEARGLAITSGGNIIVVGYSTVSATLTWTVIAYDSTGAKVTSFGPNGTGVIQEDELGAGVAYSISIASDGTLYVGGYTTPASVTVITTISYTSGGLRNPSYNP